LEKIREAKDLEPSPEMLGHKSVGPQF